MTVSGTVRRVHTVVDSPVGELTLVATGGTLSGLYMEQQRHRPPQETFGEPDPEPFTDVIAQLDEYFAGRRTEFDLAITLAGTEFQRRVWTALCEIPHGETISYGELANRLGRPTASRAVGLANGKNPIGIIVHNADFLGCQFSGCQVSRAGSWLTGPLPPSSSPAGSLTTLIQWRPWPSFVGTMAASLSRRWSGLAATRLRRSLLS